MQMPARKNKKNKKKFASTHEQVHVSQEDILTLNKITRVHITTPDGEPSTCATCTLEGMLWNNAFVDRDRYPPNTSVRVTDTQPAPTRTNARTHARGGVWSLLVTESDWRVVECGGVWWWWRW